MHNIFYCLTFAVYYFTNTLIRKSYNPTNNKQAIKKEIL